MKQLYLKEQAESVKLENVMSFKRQERNSLIDRKKAEKKAKDTEALEITKRQIVKVEQELMDLESQLQKNEEQFRQKKLLHLPLKAKWYEMIESGVKTEEYREIKPYWENRIRCQAYGVCTPNKPCLRARTVGVCDMRYTNVKFSYGYTKRTMTFEIESITIGKGKPEWGAPTEDVFIIKLGKRL